MKNKQKKNSPLSYWSCGFVYFHNIAQHFVDFEV